MKGEGAIGKGCMAEGTGMENRRKSRKALFGEGKEKQHNFTPAAPNEL